MVQLLLHAGACVDAVEQDQWTPLHLASCNGHDAVAHLLLHAKASVDAVEREQLTPLHIAC